MDAIEKTSEDYKNIIITGSFLDKGFNFDDIDIVIISKNKIDKKGIEEKIEDSLKIKPHIIPLNNKTLIEGLSTDPIYQVMLSKCIAQKRFIYKIQPKINYKILDLHLLKSKTLIDNFDVLNGNEKYYLTRNMIAINSYIKYKKVNKKMIDKKVKEIFDLKDIQQMKKNMLDKNKFLKKYKTIYKSTFNKIMKNIKNGSKQKEID